DVRARSLFSTDTPFPAEAAALALRHGGKVVSLRREKGGAWVFDEPAGFGEADPAGDPGPMSGGFTGVRPLLGFVTSLQAGGPADFLEDVSKEDETKYGLAPADAVRLDYTPASGAAEVLYLGK